MSVAKVMPAVLAACVAAFASAPGNAQKVKTETIDLQTWDYEELYANGFSAEEFMDAEVYGKGGEDIGEVADLVVSPREGVTHMIVETDAWLDVGDTHFMYPFEKAAIENLDSVTIPVDEESVERYTLFPEVENEAAPGRKWRLSELIDDYAYLKNQKRFGYVQDAIISKDGNVQAVVVSPDVVYGYDGPYAVPFYGYDYGWDPALDYYELPYEAREVAELGQLDYERLRGVPTVAVAN